jgi:Ca2+/Na+ antiporter
MAWLDGCMCTNEFSIFLFLNQFSLIQHYLSIMLNRCFLILFLLFSISLAQEDEHISDVEQDSCSQELTNLQTLLLDLFPPIPLAGENKPLQIDDYLANIRLISPF